MNRIVKGALVVLVGGAIGAAGVATRTPELTEAKASTFKHGAHATALDYISEMAAQGDIHAGHALEVLSMYAAGMQAPAAPNNPNLPADNDGAAARLAASPRKGEFVNLTVAGKPMRAWVVQPAGGGKAPVVVVIQEVFGLADWIRGVADRLAADGFIAVAPDLLANRGPNGGDSTVFANQQEAVQATLAMPADEVLAKIRAAREYGLKLPRSNGKTASVGFCFGGSQSFALAVNEPGLNAAVVYYGAAPTDAPPAAPGTPAPPFAPSAKLAQAKAPVLGLYGGLKEDARIGATIAPTEAKMKELGKIHDVHIFDGAAHGFLRAQGATTART